MLYRLSLLALCLGVLGCSGVVEKPEVAEPPVAVPEPEPEPEPPAEPEAPEPEPVDLRPEWPEGTVIEVAPLVALEPMDQVVLPAVEGGDEPITYSLLSLPDWLGLEFDPAERLLTGTPSRAGPHRFAVERFGDGHLLNRTTSRTDTRLTLDLQSARRST